MYICNRTPHVIRIYKEADCVADETKRGAFISSAKFIHVPAGEEATVRYNEDDKKRVTHECGGIKDEAGYISTNTWLHHAQFPVEVTITSMADSAVYFSPTDWAEPYTYYIVSYQFYQAAARVGHAHLSRMVTVGPAVNINDPDKRGCAGIRRD